MNVELFFVYGVLPVATMTIVPLGILLHFWRAADARPLAIPSDAAAEIAVQGWPDAAHAQLRRGQIASAVTVAVVLAGVFEFMAPRSINPERDAYLAALLIVLLCTAVLLLRSAPLGRRPQLQSGDHRVGGGTDRETSGRPPTEFGARWWFLGWSLSLIALLLAVLGGGLLSEPDENGQYTMYTLELGQSSSSTTIAGWYYGVPVVIAALLLAALVLIALRVQTAAPIGPDVPRDTWLRRNATRTLLTLSAGAAIVTLGWVLNSIGAAGRLSVTVQSLEGGVISAASPYASIAPYIQLLGQLLRGLGIALLLLPMFSRLAPIAPESLVEQGVHPAERAEALDDQACAGRAGRHPE